MNERKLSSDELMHYGVLGMKWGHRKAIPTSGGKKKSYKTAGREYSKRQFKKDVKYARKNGLDADYEYSPSTNELTIKQWYNAKGQKIGQEYASRVLAEAGKQKVSKFNSKRQNGKNAIDQIFKDTKG